MMFEANAAASILIQPVEVSGYNPPAADVWEQSVLFKCGSSTLRISGYGARRPRDRKAEITFDGEPLRGEQVEMLVKDLTVGVARYHISARCGRDGRFGLMIYTGEKSQSGDVVFHQGHAVVRDGVLLSYDSLKPIRANDFWFR